MSSPEAKRAKTTTSTRAGDSNVPGTAEAPADNGWLAALHAERLKRRGLAPVMSERDAARACYLERVPRCTYMNRAPEFIEKTYMY